eukprot:5562872-Prymnesium_polylepis.1
MGAFIFNEDMKITCATPRHDSPPCKTVPTRIGLSEVIAGRPQLPATQHVRAQLAAPTALAFLGNRPAE